AFAGSQGTQTGDTKTLSDIQHKLNEIQKTQKEILSRISDLEKKAGAPVQQRPAMDPNMVHKIPVANSQVKGNKDAPVTIVEFSDFQCPYCSQLQPTLRDVLKAYPKEVKLVFKQYPLSFHAQAKNAAKASLAAAEQGKFWEMHDIIFENFNKLSEDKFKEFAAQLGLNVEKFNADYSSAKYDKEIQEDISLGNNVGVTGTPTLFLNGKRVMKRSLEDFKEAINSELAKKK
ncbi:MAG: thioredoxin domain-containing protein, partial [Candidatus Roizmanbacteria bacterium]|nr:thioredoxin domain-containing protein [Candidatus Roizmanbacteria bacterium]